MARPFNPRVPNQREAVGFRGSWWRVVIGVLFFLVTILCAVFLLDQNGHLFPSSLVAPAGYTNMTLVNASSGGESPDIAGTMGTGGTCDLGQEHHWAALYKDLQKARTDANNYFHSQVQRRLPMDNRTLYDELQRLKAGTLYKFRTQTGDKDVTGHVLDELEVDMEKTIMDLLHLNLVIAKENNKTDRQVAAIKESDCDNITDSEVKVVCLKRLLRETLERESKERKQEKEMTQWLDWECARKGNRRVTRYKYHGLLEIKTKLVQKHLVNNLDVLVPNLLLGISVLVIFLSYLKDISIASLTAMARLFVRALATMISLGLLIFYSWVTPGTEHESVTKSMRWIEKKMEYCRCFFNDWHIIQSADSPSSPPRCYQKVELSMPSSEFHDSQVLHDLCNDEPPCFLTYHFPAFDQHVQSPSCSTIRSGTQPLII
ncbi:uncharacterized protein LOC144878393 [Branchiostoma floridae x Branchiostoma japonicum]